MRCVRCCGSRLADLVLVLFGVSVIVFLMIRLIPGDAVAIMLGANTEVTPERIAEMRGRIGLDRPIVEQYLPGPGARCTAISAPRCGPAVRSPARFWCISGRRSNSRVLALLIGAVLAVPLGCLMAQSRGGAADVAMRVGAIAGLTIPSFWLGIVLILAARAGRAGLRLPRLRAVPRGSPRQPSAHGAAGLRARPADPRQSVAPRALGDARRAGPGLHPHRARKGRAGAAVVYRHALRNALIPFVTSVGIQTGYLLGGAIVVEQVFAIPGLGRLILGAIAERNYPLIQATILVVTAGFVLVNFVVDLLYGLIDPRVSA